MAFTGCPVNRVMTCATGLAARVVHPIGMIGCSNANRCAWRIANTTKACCINLQCLKGIARGFIDQYKSRSICIPICQSWLNLRLRLAANNGPSAVFMWISNESRSPHSRSVAPRPDASHTGTGFGLATSGKLSVGVPPVWQDSHSVIDAWVYNITVVMIRLAVTNDVISIGKFCAHMDFVDHQRHVK